MPSNRSALQETSDIQRETREALRRIQQQATETQMVGQETLNTLEEQDRQLDRVTDETGKLHEKLSKTQKLQDRFVKWSLQFGTRRNAKNSARQERKEDKLMAQAKKESTPRVIEDDNQNVRAHSRDDKSPRPTEDSNRQELFGKSRRTRQKKKKGGRNQVEEEKLTAEDQEHLDQINDEDADIDNAISILGNQMDDLMNMAKSMGDEANKHGTKLEGVTTDLHEANKKQQVANKRSRMFTITRKEKRQERNLERKVALAAASMKSQLG